MKERVYTLVSWQVYLLIIVWFEIIMVIVEETKKILNLDDLRPCHLYTSRSLSVLDDRIESIKKFLRGKINFDTDFKFFYGEEEIDEKEFINFVTTPSFFSKKKVAIIKNIEKVPSSILKMITGYLSKLDRKNFDTIFIISI